MCSVSTRLNGNNLLRVRKKKTQRTCQVNLLLIPVICSAALTSEGLPANTRWRRPSSAHRQQSQSKRWTLRSELDIFVRRLRESRVGSTHLCMIDVCDLSLVGSHPTAVGRHHMTGLHGRRAITPPFASSSKHDVPSNQVGLYCHV